MKKMGRGRKSFFCVNTREEQESTQYNISKDEEVDGMPSVESQTHEQKNQQDKWWKQKVPPLAHRRQPSENNTFSLIFFPAQIKILLHQNVRSIRAWNEIYL